jgi:HlyD family secretion protein
MDVPREPRGPGRRIFAFAVVLLLIAMVTVLLRQLQPALPAVDRDLLVTAVVQRGPLPIEIRGWGELATDQVQSLDATVAGRVASVHVRPGDVVRAGSPLIGLASPDLALQTAKAEQEFTAAKAAFSALRRSIGTQRLERESVLLERRSDLARAGRSLERLESLFARGDASQEDLKAAAETVKALEEQVRVEEELLALLKETGDEQVSLEKEKLLALAEVLHREQERLSALAVTSPGDALVDAVEVGAGDWVEPGTRLVRLVRPERPQELHSGDAGHDQPFI